MVKNNRGEEGGRGRRKRTHTRLEQLLILVGPACEEELGSWIELVPYDKRRKKKGREGSVIKDSYSACLPRIVWGG